MKQSATSYFEHLGKLLRQVQVTDEHGTGLSLDEGADRAVAMVLAVRASPGKVMLIGNGGSAAIADHMQNDLCNAVAVPAMVFSHAPSLTARANDYGYESVFARPVGLWAGPDDLLVAISSSGRSENILNAARAAREKDCRVITFSGFDAGNPLRGLGHLNFYVASAEYGYVESAHSVITHFITDCAMTQGGGKASA